MNSEPISGAASTASILPGAARGAPAGAPAPSGPDSKAPATASAASPTSLSGAELDAQVRQAVEDSNAKLAKAGSALQFQVDLTPTGSVRSVKLLDASDQSVVMQFPSEQMLAVRESIDQMMQSSEKGVLGAAAGALFSKTA